MNRRSVPLVAAAGMSLLAVGAAGGWAASVVFDPGPDVPVTADYTVVEVVEGEVGQELQLITSASWPRQPAGMARAAGTVTSIAVDGTAVTAPGDVLYTVDLRPVVAGRGPVPAFRDLAEGIRGPDVSQLQGLLLETGYLRAEPDGVFGAGTMQAVRAWQRDLGVGVDGVVRAGDIIFFPALPTRLVPESQVLAVGGVLAGGEVTLQAVSGEPVFEMRVTEEQSGRIQSGALVLVQAPDGSQWEAIVTQDPRPTSDDGVVSVPLAAADGEGAVCATACDAVPVAAASQLPSTVVTVPVERGLTLPAAAVQVDASGGSFVVDATGARRPLTVRTGVAGTVLVEGVEAGQRVRVPSSGGA